MSLLLHTALAALIGIALIGSMAGAVFADPAGHEREWSGLTVGHGLETGIKCILADWGDRVGLVVLNPAWRLHEGDIHTMKIDLGGEIFTDRAIAADGSTLVLEKISSGLKKAAEAGRIATITVGDETFAAPLDATTVSMARVYGV